MPDNPIAGKAGNTTRLRGMLTYFNDNNFRHSNKEQPK